MKITKVQYLAYDRNKMFIGSFEDEEYAQRWADKHEGYVDRHLIEREENRIYDNLLIEMTREKMAKEVINFIETLKVKEDGKHVWRDNHNDCIDKVILAINHKFINGVVEEEV